MAVNKLFKYSSNYDSNYIVKSELSDFYLNKKENCYSIKYLAEGEEHYIIDGKRHILSPGSFLIVNPGQKVELEIYSDTPVLGQCYFFDTRLVSEIVQVDHKSLKEVLVKPEADLIGNLVMNTPITASGTPFENFFKSDHLSNLVDKNEVSDLLITIAEYMVQYQTSICSGMRTFSAVNQATKTELFLKLEQGRNFIHDNFKNPIALEDISTAAGISSYYFHRLFKAFFKLTPHQYITNLRLLHAQKLIIENQSPLKEVAYQSGFSDSKYFSKVYRKWLRQKGGK